MLMNNKIYLKSIVEAVMFFCNPTFKEQAESFFLLPSVNDQRIVPEQLKQTR